MRILVTGGAGFLGSHIVSQLLLASEEKSPGDADLSFLKGCKIRVLDIVDKPTYADDYLKDNLGEVEWVVGDIANSAAVLEAVTDCDAVIHCAAAVDNGSIDDMFFNSTNVIGTNTVISCCKKANVESLVYTSASGILVGKKGVDGLDEDNADLVQDIEPQNMSRYIQTKTAAERAVLEANCSTTSNGTTQLLTCSIRPVAMYGPGDPYHLLELLKFHQSLGENVFRTGDAKVVFQMAYASNIAYMHLCALQKLWEQDSRVAGETFMGIDNTKVRNFFEFCHTYEAYLGYKIPTTTVPETVLLGVAAIGNVAKKALGSFMNLEESFPVTYEKVFALATNQWFLTNKAKMLLEYEPIFSPLESRQLTKDWLDHLINEKQVLKKGTYDYGNKYEYEDDGSCYFPDKFVNSKRMDQHKLNEIRNNKFLYDDWTESVYTEALDDRRSDFTDYDIDQSLDGI